MASIDLSMKFLRSINWVATRIAIVANAIGTLVVLGLVMVVNYDVIGREFFNQSFHGAVELVQFSMVLIVFLQLPDVIRVNRLTRSDGFLSIAANRFPLLKTILSKVINLIAFVFMVLIAVAIFPEFLEMWETKDYFGVPGVFTAPWWPVKLVIFISAVLSSVIFALKILLPEEEHNGSSASLLADPVAKPRA